MKNLFVKSTDCGVCCSVQELPNEQFGFEIKLSSSTTGVYWSLAQQTRISIRVEDYGFTDEFKDLLDSCTGFQENLFATVSKITEFLAAKSKELAVAKAANWRR